MNDEIIDTNKQAGVPKKGKAGKVVGCGCLVIILLILAGLVFVYFAAQKDMEEFINEYSEDSRIEIQKPVNSKETIDKLDNFLNSLKDNKPTDSLALTAEEINQLLNYYPDSAINELAKIVSITSITDKINGIYTIDLNDFPNDAGKGKFFNSEATYAFNVKDGQLFVYMTKVIARDKELPEKFLNRLNMLLLQWLNSYNPGTDKTTLLSKIERVGVSEGKLIIQPKAQ